MSRLSGPRQLFRKRNGCDAETKRPQFRVTCPRCDGARSLPSGDDCDLCELGGTNRGTIPVHRCARSCMTGEVAAAVNAYYWVENGIPPEPGGRLDQSPSFLEFCSVFGAESARVREEVRPK